MPGEPGNLARRVEYSTQGLHVRAWFPELETLPPAVLLHGAVIGGQYMVPLAEELARSMRVYVPDLPGLGSSRSLAAPRDVDEAAHVLRAWMAREKLTEVVLVGNSLGAQLATRLARMTPPAVRVVVLVGPTMDVTARPLFELAQRSARLVMSEPLPLHLMWLRDAAKAGLRRSIRYCWAAWTDHVEDRLTAVAAPALVVRGTGDKIVSQRWAEWVTGQLPLGRLLVVTGAGHAAHYNRPADVAAAILDLVRLAAVPAAPAAPVPGAA